MHCLKKILGTRNSEGITILNFVSFFDNQPIPSEVIIQDISLLTLSHLSAALQYPVINIRAQYQIELNEQSRWWIVGIVLGSGILIILFGWCCLFVYYNSCGRPIQKYHPNAIEEIQNKDLEIEVSKHGKYTNKRWIESSEIRRKQQQPVDVADKLADAVPTSPISMPKIPAKEEELQKLPPLKNEVKSKSLSERNSRPKCLRRILKKS
uniref:Uncharacterized protein n=1 Tax=Panagrolaimus sp. PS1159 TaxID=55785 RepID=A0AC35FPW6_9BILA